MGARPASADDDDTVWLWDAASGEQIGLLQGHTRWVRAVVFSPDGRQLASAGKDRTVRLWDAQSHAEISQLTLESPAAALAWGPRGISLGTLTGLMQLEIIARDSHAHTDPARTNAR